MHSNYFSHINNIDALFDKYAAIRAARSNTDKSFEPSGLNWHHLRVFRPKFSQATALWRLAEVVAISTDFDCSYENAPHTCHKFNQYHCILGYQAIGHLTLTRQFHRLAGSTFSFPCSTAASSRASMRLKLGRSRTRFECATNVGKSLSGKPPLAAVL